MDFSKTHTITISEDVVGIIAMFLIACACVLIKELVHNWVWRKRK